MIANTGTFGPIRLLLASAALLALGAPSPARGDDPTREEFTTKIPNFFYFDYPFGDQAGKRLWLRVDDRHWIERYPDGMQTRFKLVKRAREKDVNGIIVVRLDDDPDEKGDGFQVFIPDKGSESMVLMFRADEGGEWANLGEMQKVE